MARYYVNLMADDMLIVSKWWDDKHIVLAAPVSHYFRDPPYRMIYEVFGEILPIISHPDFKAIEYEPDAKADALAYKAEAGDSQ